MVDDSSEELSADTPRSPADRRSAKASSGGEIAPATQIGRYRIVSKLGEGGMGVVFEAEDAALDRRVALKFLKAGLVDPAGTARLVREARMAARLSDPSVCQIFDVGEWNGQPFLALELVRGEPLSSRAGTPFPPTEALRIAAAVARGLGTLHAHGIVHRDLKPSNIFVTADGIKLVDFGLARAVGPEAGDESLTQLGVFVGTPQYAAPEQLAGDAVDGRADLFSLGVILFEMLVGRPPFSGASLYELVDAIRHQAAPVLTGGPATAAVDRIVQRGLEKHPDRRYQTADAFAADLGAALGIVDEGTVTEVRTLTRLAVLPFRMLKADPDLEYLSASLADVIADALSDLQSLIVRSTMQTARYASAAPDVRSIAETLAVDAVLTGSILRVDDRLRLGAQLVSAATGDVLWSDTISSRLDQVFELHDEMARLVAGALPLSIADRQPRRRTRRVSSRAFDLYLRGMEIRLETSRWRQAASLFDECLRVDPEFAPAWAERGRLDRVLGKYGEPARLDDAEHALHRALEIDPDNAAAHAYLAQLEIDTGQAESAMARLVARAARHQAEPHVYAGLVHACRYCGLLDASLAAHARARRLDPTVRTSVAHTYYMRGEYGLLLGMATESTDPIEARALAASGRDRDAIAAARREESRFAAFPQLRAFCTALRAALEQREAEALEAVRLLSDAGTADGEAHFYVAEIYARLARADEAMAALENAVRFGFVCAAAFQNDPPLHRLRGDERLATLLTRVRERQNAAAARFEAAGGRAILPC